MRKRTLYINYEGLQMLEDSSYHANITMYKSTKSDKNTNTDYIHPIEIQYGDKKKQLSEIEVRQVLARVGYGNDGIWRDTVIDALFRD